MNVVEQISIGGYDDNFSYFVGGDKEVAIVDPGNVGFLVGEIERRGLIPRAVLITHGHFDHTEGAKEMAEKYGIPVYIHKNGKGKEDVPEKWMRYVDEGDEIEVGGVVVKVLYTPGHSDDSVCYYIEGNGAVGKLITGDTLFVEACGRADLPGSNAYDLYESLMRIKGLPDETEIYPGHDYGSKPISSVKEEKKNNRYLKCKDIEEFSRERGV